MEIFVVKITCTFCAATENIFTENRSTDPAYEHDKLVSHASLWSLGQNFKLVRRKSRLVNSLQLHTVPP